MIMILIMVMMIIKMIIIMMMMMVVMMIMVVMMMKMMMVEITSYSLVPYSSSSPNSSWHTKNVIFPVAPPLNGHLKRPVGLLTLGGTY